MNSPIHFIKLTLAFFSEKSNTIVDTNFGENLKKNSKKRINKQIFYRSCYPARIRLIRRINWDK